MARFTDVIKVALTVEVAQGGPVAPTQTMSGPLAAAQQPSIPMGSSATAPGGMATGLQVGTPAPNAGGAAIRSDQPQPQPGMQTSQSLPQTQAPGAAKAFKAPTGATSKAPAVPKMPTPSASAVPSPTKKGMLLAICSAASKQAHPGFPTERLPDDAMPVSPAAQFGSVMDVMRPMRHPITSTKNFLSGLGAEADKQLTQSMIAQPVTIHQMQYQQHPTATN